MTEEEVIDLIADYLDRKVVIATSGRVANRQQLARKVVYLAKRLKVSE